MCARGLERERAVSDVGARLTERAALAGVTLEADLLENLLVYVDLLTHWNRRMNLTAFDLSAPSDQAIDRLFVEPVLAARLVRPEHRRALDIGSGGGSPAVPLTLAAPWLDMTMVEVRAKKAAFLREVARVMPVALRVECARVETLAESGAMGAMDLITFRAVRADRSLWSSVDTLLGMSGMVLWFGGHGQRLESGVFRSAAEADAVCVVERKA